MAVRNLHRGAQVADAAFPNSSFPDALVASGYEGFCGYLSSPTGNPKNWSKLRLSWFKGSGLGLGLFCEQFETIVFQGYSPANLALGRQCEAMADAFGAPDDAPLWYAVDTSPFGHFTEIAASFEAYNDTTRRPVYAYCGSQCGEFLMDEGLVQGFHVPSAYSWSATQEPYNGTTVFFYNGTRNRWYLSPLANMLQHPSIDFFGSRIDANDVLRETPFWFPDEADPPPPPPPTGDIDMAASFMGCVTLTPSGAAGAVVFGSDGQYYRYDNHPGGIFYAWPRGSMGDAEYAGLPVYNPVADAYWVADRMKERGVGAGTGGTPKAVRITSVPGDAQVVY